MPCGWKNKHLLGTLIENIKVIPKHMHMLRIPCHRLRKLSTQVSSEAYLVQVDVRQFESILWWNLNLQFLLSDFSWWLPLPIDCHSWSFADIANRPWATHHWQTGDVETRPDSLHARQHFFRHSRIFGNPFGGKTQKVFQVSTLRLFCPSYHRTFLNPQIVLDDDQLWFDAVKDLKPNSGRGIDAISSSELKGLPNTAISDLAKVMTSYQLSFPDWFMLARTIPLQKVHGRPRASQTRPITVLAQLFRVWGRVLAKQLLHHFAKVMPPSITGMLAARGPPWCRLSSAILVGSSTLVWNAHIGFLPWFGKMFQHCQ